VTEDVLFDLAQRNTDRDQHGPIKCSRFFCLVSDEFNPPVATHQTFETRISEKNGVSKDFFIDPLLLEGIISNWHMFHPRCQSWVTEACDVGFEYQALVVL